MIDRGVKIKNKDAIQLFLISLGDEAKKLSLPLSVEARNRGINSLLGLGAPSMKAQLKKANRVGASYVAIIGIMEAKKKVCQLKNMEK